MVLIITNKEDVHPTPVIEHLNERNVPVFRLNTEALMTDYHFCWQCDSDDMGTPRFRIKNIHTGLEIRDCEMMSVWDRRPEMPAELPVDCDPQVKKHNLNEALGFLRFLRYSIKDIWSIGSIVNDRIASSKMLQLRTARDVGFLTPDTCFSNRKEDILKFASRYENVVLKPIENASVWDEENDREYVFYTRKVALASLAVAPEQAFSQTVSYVQNYIEKQFELRVTVIRVGANEHYFACKIDSQTLDEDKGKIDWRQGYDYGLKHEIFDLPLEIKDQCFTYLMFLDLNFGCFDFIVTPSGEYVFLECNPNGQWLWIEQETGMKISNAIADSLTWWKFLKNGRTSGKKGKRSKKSD